MMVHGCVGEVPIVGCSGKLISKTYFLTDFISASPVKSEAFYEQFQSWMEFHSIALGPHSVCACTCVPVLCMHISNSHYFIVIFPAIRWCDYCV